MQPPILSRSPIFHFETVRALSASPFDGADFGEVAAAIAQVKRGDFESWFAQWSRLAAEVGSRAADLTDPSSRGKALLRASTYLRTAEFYLHPSDPRRPDSARGYRTWFDDGLRLLGVDATRSRLPYEGGELETIFLRSDVPGAENVLVVHGGFDSTAEELYFVIGAAALERGYHVLIFEGPGQGSVLREFGMPFTPDWARPAAVVLDSLAQHCDPASIIGVGLSFGGHLLAKAATVEKRYDAIVLFDYFPSMLDAFKHQMPAALRGQLARMPRWMRTLVGLYARVDPELRWGLQNAHWAFGTTGLPELISEIARYEDQSWAADVDADVLVLLGADERFYDKRLGHDFASRLGNARSVAVHEFSSESGGGLHCQVGAYHLAHEVIFDWTATTTNTRRHPSHLPTAAPS